jgi:hypothetical protein
MLCDLGLDELSTTPPPGLTRQHVILAETKHANVLHTVVYGVDYQGTVRLNFYQTSPNSNNAGKGLACWVGGWVGGACFRHMCIVVDRPVGGWQWIRGQSMQPFFCLFSPVMPTGQQGSRCL